MTTQEPDDGFDIDGFDIDGLKDAAYALEAILQRAGEGATVGHVIALLENLAQPEQEPVAWMTINAYGEEDDIHYENPEGHLLEGWTYKPLYTHPSTIQPEKEPLEYWNAVEGWVKIDEVREHFDSVGCGTIYKTAGENRVPLYTTPPAAQWDKPSASFNDWWDSDSDSKADSANPFRNGSAAYWAWAGWQAAQRPWVGLTDDEIDIIYQGAGKHDLLNARAIEAKLKERNT